MTLQYKLDDSIMIDGAELKVNASFDVILRLFDLLEDDRISPYERVELSLKMILGTDLGEKYDILQKKEILEQVLKEYVQLEEKTTLDIMGNPMPPTETDRILDYKEDAALIYAAFMQVYGIDLIEQQGKLHWSKFQALMNGLPDGTKIGQIMSYRAWNEFDDKKDYKQFMREQKEYWRLGGNNG